MPDMPFPVAQSSADVLLAADDLSDDHLNTAIQFFHRASNAKDVMPSDMRAYMRANMILLCAIRDKKRDNMRNLEKSLRNPKGREPDYPRLKAL